MAQSRILQPGELEEARGGIEECLLPRLDLFARREQRCRWLARQGNVLAAYLDFVARISALQQEELQSFLQDGRDAASSTVWPLVWESRAQVQAWALVRRLGAKLAAMVAPEQQKLFRLLPQEEPTWFSEQVNALLAGSAPTVSLATAPLTAVALQVAWSGRVLGLAQKPPARHEESRVCPVCGGQPVAGLIMAAGVNKGLQGLRYLHCGLCGSSWHMVRSKCSHCGESRDISYVSLQGEMEHVRAEACGDCRSYLKVMYQQEEPGLEPLADDLATLALDLRMAEEGYLRSGTNPLFFPGPASSSA
ncbi:MAG: formate dehydrogenase accessory protein FdhE [Desulfobulbus sp.]|jgi:FdhE protein